MQVKWDPHHSLGVMVGPNAVGPNNDQGQAPMYTTFIPQVVPRPMSTYTAPGSDYKAYP